MEIPSVGEFKSNFSEVLKKVLSGEEIGIGNIPEKRFGQS